MNLQQHILELQQAAAETEYGYRTAAEQITDGVPVWQIDTDHLESLAAIIRAELQDRGRRVVIDARPF